MTADRTLSQLQRSNHRAVIASAGRVRYDGAQHARLMETAARCRFYFQQFRRLERLGEGATRFMQSR